MKTNRKELFNIEVSNLKRNEQLKFNAFVDSQIDLDSEFSEIVTKYFWDII